MSALRSSVLAALTWFVGPPAAFTWRQPHRRATSSQMLLLIAVVANLQFAATLTHAWYLENVPVRLASVAGLATASGDPEILCCAELSALKNSTVAVVDVAVKEQCM